MLRNARLTSVFLCVLMLVSCARTAPPDISRQLEEVDLREVIGVLSVSPEYHYDEFGIRPSYIVFIYRDGSTRPIRVGETVFADVSWVSGSLFFADRHNDYWVMSGGEVRIHRADHIKEQNGIVELETDNKRVMLLNAGFAPDGGYRQQMDISTPEGSQVSEIGAFSTIFAACEDDAFIIDTQPPDGPEDDNRSTSTLY
ncbi:MAG: hypothetical protein Q4C87_05325 [Actinomycetaceae bacterium]|nr:hypothetical protein [Actinomycetaceae bacterium]